VDHSHQKIEELNTLKIDKFAKNLCIYQHESSRVSDVDNPAQGRRSVHTRERASVHNRMSSAVLASAQVAPGQKDVRTSIPTVRG